MKSSTITGKADCHVSEDVETQRAVERIFEALTVTSVMSLKQWFVRGIIPKWPVFCFPLIIDLKITETEWFPNCIKYVRSIILIQREQEYVGFIHQERGYRPGRMGILYDHYYCTGRIFYRNFTCNHREITIAWIGVAFDLRCFIVLDPSWGCEP